MTTVDVITGLFCRVDDAMTAGPKPAHAKLYPREVGTMALLFVLQGGGDRPFSRWVERDDRPLFARLPQRTRLFRLFVTHQDGADRVLAAPPILGLAASYGVALLHPYREQRRPRLGRSGRTGLSTQRWIVGGKRAVVRNTGGLVCGWAADTATVHASAFPPLIARFAAALIVLADGNFARADGNPPNLKVGARGTWNDRMRVETTFSMLTLVCHLKTVLQRAWRSFTMRLAYTMALFHVLVQGDGLARDAHGCAPRSIAPFSL